MDDENSGVRQSVEEAQALVEKAKACVQRLSGPNPTPVSHNSSHHRCLLS